MDENQVAFSVVQRATGNTDASDKPTKNFSWYEATQVGDVLIRPTSAVAVYDNPDGDVVIRRRADEYEDEDAVVVIPRDRVSVLIDKLKTYLPLKEFAPEES